MQGKAARDDPEIPDPIGFSEHSYQNIEKCEIKDGQKLIKIDIRGCNRNPASNGYGDLTNPKITFMLISFGQVVHFNGFSIQCMSATSGLYSMLINRDYSRYIMNGQTRHWSFVHTVIAVRGMWRHKDLPPALQAPSIDPGVQDLPSIFADSLSSLPHFIYL